MCNLMMIVGSLSDRTSQDTDTAYISPLSTMKGRLNNTKGYETSRVFDYSAVSLSDYCHKWVDEILKSLIIIVCFEFNYIMIGNLRNFICEVLNGPSRPMSEFNAVVRANNSYASFVNFNKENAADMSRVTSNCREPDSLETSRSLVILSMAVSVECSSRYTDWDWKNLGDERMWGHSLDWTSCSNNLLRKVTFEVGR